jgi:hypothetical protein
VGCSFNWTGCNATNVVIGVRVLYGLPRIYRLLVELADARHSKRRSFGSLGSSPRRATKFVQRSSDIRAQPLAVGTRQNSATVGTKIMKCCGCGKEFYKVEMFFEIFPSGYVMARVEATCPSGNTKYVWYEVL